MEITLEALVEHLTKIRLIGLTNKFLNSPEAPLHFACATEEGAGEVQLALELAGGEWALLWDEGMGLVHVFSDRPLSSLVCNHLPAPEEAVATTRQGSVPWLLTRGLYIEKAVISEGWSGQGS